VVEETAHCRGDGEFVAQGQPVFILLVYVLRSPLPTVATVGTIVTMLVEPGTTNFDLPFPAGSETPVRVHPFFWLFSAIFAGNLLNDPNGDGFVRIVPLDHLLFLVNPAARVWPHLDGQGVFGARQLHRSL